MLQDADVNALKQEIDSVKKSFGSAQKRIEELELEVNEKNDKLSVLNESLAILNSDLTQFATIAFHHLQEPIRKVRTYASYLKKAGGSLNQEERDFAEKIENSARRMSDLISDLLTYVILLRPQDDAVENTDLNEIVDQILADQESLILEKKAVIKKDLLPMIEAVPSQIRQLFYSLLSNALKFTKAGIKPVIEITSSYLSKSDVSRYPTLNAKLTYCKIKLSDNGIGFEQRFATHIFKIFQKLSSKEEYPGTGMGLALAQKIAINHHGIIAVEADEQSGARFYLIVPIKIIGEHTERAINQKE